MQVDTLTDAELEALTDLANKEWVPGFDGSVMPGRIQTMRNGENMRRIMKMAGAILNMNRAELTAAVHKMRGSSANAKQEQDMLDALNVGIEWTAGQAGMLSEARERMRCADARVKLMALKP